MYSLLIIHIFEKLTMNNNHGIKYIYIYICIEFELILLVVTETVQLLGGVHLDPRFQVLCPPSKLPNALPLHPY